ncbi:MAG: cytochrome c [Akkermansiaceae bacterium]|nr:cytochrome c [Akkermansiaceae bacterium]
MDPNRDNPIIRFSAFWLGLGIVLIFAAVLVVIAFFDRDTPSRLDAIEAQKADQRYEIKEEVEAAQTEDLPAEAIEAAIPQVAQSLVEYAPEPLVKPEWVVPGSETAKRIEEGPAADFAAVDAMTEEGPIDPAVMELGKAQYMTCAACHGQNGEGGPIGPPLANSEWVTGPVSNLIRIQLRGLKGAITVNGKEYNFAAPMAPLAYQSDEQIAAVLTYIRNSFGNEAAAVKPAQVEALRDEVGKPMLTVEDLIQP